MKRWSRAASLSWDLQKGIQRGCSEISYYKSKKISASVLNSYTFELKPEDVFPYCPTVHHVTRFDRNFFFSSHF